LREWLAKSCGLHNLLALLITRQLSGAKRFRSRESLEIYLCEN